MGCNAETSDPWHSHHGTENISQSLGKHIEEAPRAGRRLPLSAHQPLEGDGAAPRGTVGPRQPPAALSPLSAEAHRPRMCLSGGGKQTINHSGCDGSWVRAMTVAAPSAPFAKGNKQGTGVLAARLRDAIRLQCCLSSQGAGQLQRIFISNRGKGCII